VTNTQDTGGSVNYHTTVDVTIGSRPWRIRAQAWVIQLGPGDEVRALRIFHSRALTGWGAARKVERQARRYRAQLGRHDG
jgi:hypothetical protein